MKNNVKILWIDDDKARLAIKRILEAAIKSRVDFISDFNELEKLLDSQKIFNYDLILIDHTLTTFNSPIMKEGTSATDGLRKISPNTPIICVTGGDRYLDTIDKTIYDKVLDISSLSKNYKSILNTALTVKKLKRIRIWSINKLIDLLQPPEEEKYKIESILPTKIKQSISSADKTIISLLFKWLDETLLKKPGMLLDRIWASTILGINERGFSKIESSFIDTKYDGIFNNDDTLRWWKLLLEEKVFSLTADKDTNFTWIAGRTLPGIHKNNYSKCWVCEKSEPPPNTVAYISPQSNECHPMHLSCTIADSRYQKELFFEEIRIVRPK